LGIQRRLIGNPKPAIWESGGPAHHRINAENVYFYSTNANSRIEVTPKVTPAVAVAEWASRDI
jgi:hypothetical protein